MCGASTCVLLKLLHPWLVLSFMVHTVPGCLFTGTRTQDFGTQGRTHNAKENSVNLFHSWDPERIRETGYTRVPCVGKPTTLALTLEALVCFNTGVQRIKRSGPDPCCVATQSRKADGPVVCHNLLHAHFELSLIAFVPPHLQSVHYQAYVQQDVLICRFICFVKALVDS